MKMAMGGGPKLKAPKITKRGYKTSRKAILATTGRKGRLTGYKDYESYKLNQTPVAKKARSIEAATSKKKPGLPSRAVAYPTGMIKNLNKNAARARNGKPIGKLTRSTKKK